MGAKRCLFDNVAGNQLLHDLVSSSVDTGHAAVRIGARDVVLPHVAGPAVHLHALVGHLALQVREPVLGHGGCGVVQLLGAQQLDAAVGKGAAHGDLRLQGGQAVLDGLQVGQGRAERLAVLDVGASPLEAGLGRRDGHDRHQQALLGQLVHQVDKALVGLTEHGAGWHAAVLEEQLAGILGVHAHLLQLVALDETLGAFVHKEQGDALGALGGLRLGAHDHHVAVPAVGDIGLAAVDNVVVSVASGHGAHTRQV
jgi:hypothetical protein